MIKKVLFVILILLFSIKIRSQSTTGYEKRLNFLSENFLKKLGVNKSSLNFEILDIKSMLNSKEVYDKLATPNGIKLLQQFLKELEDIEKYKNEIDIKKENLIKEREFNKNQIEVKSQIEKKYKDQYANSDYSLFITNVKNRFIEWKKKSEFETSLKYETRIRDSSKLILYNIFANNFEKYIDNKKNNIRFSLQKYNADNEIYILDVFCYDREVKWNISGVIFGIPLEIAKKLKSKESENGNQLFLSFKRETHWLINNNNFVPFSGIIDFEGKEYTVFLQWNPEICSQTIFNSYKTDITNEEDKVIFNWDEFLQKEKEAKANESLNLIHKDEIDTVSTPYTFPSNMPEFPGGEDSLNSYLQKNLRYPNAAAVNKVEGTVIVEFVVNVDGSLSNLKVVQGIKGDCNEEALRLVKLMPKWTPGKQGDQNVRVYNSIHIKFELDY